MPYWHVHYPSFSIFYCWSFLIYFACSISRSTKASVGIIVTSNNRMLCLHLELSTWSNSRNPIILHKLRKATQKNNSWITISGTFRGIDGVITYTPNSYGRHWGFEYCKIIGRLRLHWSAPYLVQNNWICIREHLTHSNASKVGIHYLNTTTKSKVTKRLPFRYPTHQYWCNHNGVLWWKASWDWFTTPKMYKEMRDKFTSLKDEWACVCMR